MSTSCSCTSPVRGIRSAQRLTARLDHYMPASLLDSQISTLEAVDPDEQAIVVDVGGSPAKIAEEILRRVETFEY